MIQRTRQDKIIDVILYVLLALLCFSMLYPFWNSVVLSFNDGEDAIRGGITVWPRQVTLANYEYVLQDRRLARAYGVTIYRTIAGTAISIILTSQLAFGLSKRNLIARKQYMWIAVFTMYFAGGLIPFYLLIRGLGLINNVLVYVFVLGGGPALVSVFHMIIFRSFFLGIPESLEDSARIDGAGYYTVFYRIVVPVSTPVFATLILFQAVAHWNSWFDGAIFMTDPNRVPLQTLLRQIINSNAMEELMNELQGTAAEALAISSVTTRTLSMATMVFATLPILFAYPFLQRFFVHGLMIGSLKG